MVNTKFILFSILIVFSIAAFEFTVNPFNWIVYIVRNVMIFLLILYVFNEKKIDKDVCAYFYFYLLVSFTGLFFSLPYSLYYIDWVQQDYNNFIGRIFNLLTLSFFSVAVVSFFIKNSDKARYIFSCYYFSIFILLLSCIYHFLSFKYSFLPFPFETRSNLHSFYDSVDGVNRATGFSREPSFLANYATEFFILSIFILRGFIKYISLMVFIMVVSITFSPSLVLGLALSFIIYFVMTLKYYEFKKIIFFSTLASFTFFVVLVLLKTLDSLLFNYIKYRIFNAGESGRFISIFNALDIMYNQSNFYNFLFGYGLGSYRLLDDSPLRNFYYSKFSQTSNNIFIDVFFECGLVGLIILLLFFLFLYMKIALSKQDIHQKKFAFFLLSSLVVGSCYRGDFSSLHFFIILVLIFLLIKVNVFLKR